MPAAHDCYLVALSDGVESEDAAVLVHPANGNGLGYRDLAAALPSLRLFAFQSGGFGDGRRTLDSIDALAARYAECLGAHRLGPVLLGGWSFGALVAVELAVRAGPIRSGPIVLVDPPPHEDEPPARRLEIAAALEEIAAVSGRLRSADAQTAKELECELAQRLADLSLPTELLALDPDDLHAYLERQVAHYRARLRHRLGRIEHDVLLVACTGTLAKPDGARYVDGWRAIVDGSFELAEIPGRHDALVVDRKSVEALAAVLSRAAAAGRRPPATGERRVHATNGATT